ncbi:PGPGW domain-containing protein [Granulosicoccaceae sp. 1_MG-2023]|nr:PGPGW domain-containing protein [Granulosicoccaceae sp. 1_MG-2023]
MMKALTDFIAANEVLVSTLTLSSVVFFIGSLLAIPWLVARLPQNYFTDTNRHKHRAPRSLGESLLILGKNTIGALLVLAGIAMLVLPGQGLLCILIGLSLTNFPGKFKLERRLIRTPAIYRALNWIRDRRGQPPLALPD